MSPEERAAAWVSICSVECAVVPDRPDHCACRNELRELADEFRAARREALEEAARVADCYDDRAARDIRALIEKEPKPQKEDGPTFAWCERCGAKVKNAMPIPWEYGCEACNYGEDEP